MSMPRAVRHINEVRVLDVLFRSGPTSRAGLARELSLTRSTASSIVANLVRDGLVVENQGEPADKGTRTGRPSVDVRLNAPFAIFLGAEIGVGRCTVIAIDLNANVIDRTERRFELTQATPSDVASDIADLVRSLVDELSMPKAIRGVAVTVPGLLDHEGNVLRAPFLGWSNVPILRMIRERLSEIHTIEAENDANAFAIAEIYKAGKSAPSDAVYLLLDAGVGGAIVSGGKLLRGHDGYAGELGHILVGDEGFTPTPTLSGSLESFVGRDAVLNRNRMRGGSAETIDEFIECVQQGADSADATLRDWSHYLGRGLATLVSTLNPEKIVLGGATAVLLNYTKREVFTAVRQHLLPSQPLPSIELSTLGSDAAAIGGASMLHQSMFSFDESIVFRR